MSARDLLKIWDEAIQSAFEQNHRDDSVELDAVTGFAFRSGLGAGQFDATMQSKCLCPGELSARIC